MIKALLFAMPESSPAFDKVALIPNLGIVSIAGNVDPTVCDVKVADLLVVRRRLEHRVLSLLKKQSPDLVGFSCMSFHHHSAIRLAKLVKAYNKNILVVIGGYHPSAMYEEISESPDSQFIDFIVRGEGEATFSELVTAIDSGTAYDKILGLSYKAGGVFHHNPPRALMSLDSIRLPDRGARLITKGFNTAGMPTEAIETSRGCTLNCKFCSIRQMYGRSYRKYEISRVIADIKDARKHGASWIMVTDDNITLDLRRLEMLCDEIIAAKLNSLHYFIQASVKGIAHSRKLVQKMADAGVKMVFIGIESASKKNLDFLGKETSSPELARKAMKYLRDNGMITLGGFIIGSPDDNEESLWQAFHTAWNLKVDVPGFGILIPQVKTEIRAELMAEGLITNPDDFSTYHNGAANIRTRHLTSEQLKSIMDDMYRAYQNNIDYVRFNQLRKTYPLFFWKVAAEAFPAALLNLLKEGLKAFGSR